MQATQKTPTPIPSNIIFLYYNDLAPAIHFYEDIMGLTLVEDQTWAKIFRITDGSFIGIVDGTRGHHPARQDNSVTLSFNVADVQAWYDHFVENGVPITIPPQFHESIQVEGFFAKDPGGYTVEIQRFAKLELASVFH